MNLLVTGGCGFIGSNFIISTLKNSSLDINLLVNLDALTYAGNLDNLTEIENDSRYIFVKGNMGNVSLVNSLLSTHKVNAVISFASESHVDNSISSPLPFVDANVSDFARLLETCRSYYNTLPSHLQQSFRFLQVSTDEVYGSLGPNSPSSTESCPFFPNSPYAATKAAADHLAKSYYKTYNFPVIITRCSNNYGPRQYPEKLIPVVITRALSSQPIPIYGNGLQVRDWIHVQDHIDALLLILTKAKPGSVYNIGGSMEKTNIETVTLICKTLDQLSPITSSYTKLITHVPDRPGHDTRYSLDYSLLTSHFGWTPKISFEQGMKSTIQWYLSNPAWSAKLVHQNTRQDKLGILLAGGTGSRLYPTTKFISKHLLPVYDKPMILYSLWLLTIADIHEILIITTPQDLPRYQELLGDGSSYNLTLHYTIQSNPEGVAQAFQIAQDAGFLNPDHMPSTIALVLGDNLLYGPDLCQNLIKASKPQQGARIFACQVDSPQAYGVVTFSNNQPISLQEKPDNPTSNWAVPGIYFYDNQVLSLSSLLTPQNGELVITDLNNLYLAKNQLSVQKLNATWFDMGTPDTLLQASNFVKQVQRDGNKIGL